MNAKSSSSLPPDLQKHLQEEAPEEHDRLSQVWVLLGGTEPPYTGDVPDADDTWDAVQARLQADADAGSTTSSEAAPPAAASARSDRSPSSGASGASEPSKQGEGLASAASRSTRAARSPARGASSRLSRVQWTAAVAVLLLAGGLWLWTQPVRVNAPAGGQATATLPDGSTVELNSATTLTYDRGFRTWFGTASDQRTVSLNGEAFFSVEKGDRPFIINTVNAQVEVLGTSFNVRAREDAEPTTDVTVATGRVRVSGPANAGSVVLDQPGQSSRVEGTTASPTAPSAGSVDRTLVWREKGLAISNQPLPALLRELERRYDLTLTLEPGLNAGKRSLSLYYPSATRVEGVLQDITVALDLAYEKTDTGYRVYDPE